MFDIGFWELVMVGVVALLVVGPKELPALAHNIGRGIGKLRGFIGAMKADLNYEIEKANELNRLMEKESEIAELHRILKENAAKALEQSRPVVATTEVISDVIKVEQADGITPADTPGTHTDQRPAQPVADRSKTE